MANHILRHILYDIQSDLKQSIDDTDITLTKVAFWTITIANRIKSQQIDKRDSGAFLHVFPKVPIIRASNNNTPDLIKDRPCILLPKSIYDFDQDGGVEYIGYSSHSAFPRYTNLGFTRTKAGRKTERLYYSKYEKPSPKNPYWYRTGDYIGFLGIENVNVDFIEIGLYSTIDPITDIDIDKPFDFPEELLPILKRQVLDLGRFVLMVPSDRTNDGNDKPDGSVPTQKLVSVNDQATSQPQQQQSNQDQ